MYILTLSDTSLIYGREAEHPAPPAQIHTYAAKIFCAQVAGKTFVPDVASPIIYWGDSGVYHPHAIQWCDAADVDSLVGYSTNEPLKKQGTVAELKECTREAFEYLQDNPKCFIEIHEYQARSGKQAYQLIGKYELFAAADNARFVLTRLGYEMEALYRDHSCARDDMENKIKERK